MTSVTDARSPAWATPEHNAINCEVKFSDAINAQGEPVYLPWVATPNDPMPCGRQLFTDLKAGMYGEIAPFVVTPAMVEQAKADKYQEINDWREQQENGRITFTLNGHTWDCSKDSQQRLAPAIAVAKAGSLPAGFFWTDADNNDVPVSQPQLLEMEAAMQAAMVAQGFKIHERQRQMKKDVAQLTDLLQIRNYQPGWP